MTHATLSKALKREPGMPESFCPGELDPVNGSGKVLTYRKADANPFLDAALRSEGEFGEIMRIDLYRCRLCKETIVAARKPGETNRLVGFQRNQWREKPSRDPAPLAATA